MKRQWKSFVCLASGFVLTVCFAITSSAQGAGDQPSNCGTNFDIKPPPSGSMVQVSNQGTENGDDNLVWSHSGNYLAVDRSDPTVPAPNKYIFIIDLTSLNNIRQLGARSSAAANPVYANITDWTCNDDRVLFGWQPQTQGAKTIVSSRTRLMSCAAFGDTNVNEFLKDPAGALHVFSPSVVYDPLIQKERLLFLTSTATGDPAMDSNPSTRVNVWTVPFNSAGTPDWNEKVRLTAFDATNIQVQSVRWCPEFGTNYQPLVNRYALVVAVQSAPTVANPSRSIVAQSYKMIVTFSGVRDIINSATNTPVNLADPRFSLRDPQASSGSQVSWTQNGVYLMYCKNAVRTNQTSVSGKPQPQPQAADELYSVRSLGVPNPTIFETPDEFIGSNKQWLCISPDGMRAAFTVNKKVYVMPMQFDNMAIAGSSNLLSDGGYTRLMIPGGALNSNCTVNILSPNAVDTNDSYVTLINESAREFSVNGQTNQQFNFNTNVELSLHFSTNNFPTNITETNLSVLVYNPTNVQDGHTGTWTEVDNSTLDPTNKYVTAQVSHFSLYAIGRVASQPVTIPRADPGMVILSNWYLWLSAMGYQMSGPFNFGVSALPVAADFDADGKADPAMVDGALWYIWFTRTGYQLSGGPWNFGVAGYPVAADFDADGKADPAMVVGPLWYIWFSGAGYQLCGGPWNFGVAGFPVAGDFDADGKADPCMVVGPLWYIWFSGAGYQLCGGPWNFGVAGFPVAGDFDADGKADPAMVVNALWYIWFSGAGYQLCGGPWNFGVAGFPVAADFDGR